MDDWGDWESHGTKPPDIGFNVQDDTTVGGQFGVINGNVYITGADPSAPPPDQSGKGRNRRDGVTGRQTKPIRRPRKLFVLVTAVIGVAGVAVVLFAVLARSPQSGARCTATAKAYNAETHGNNVYVHSNQPHARAEVSADGYANHYQTNGSGDALVYLDGPRAGATIAVTVGGASCTTKA